MKAQKEIETIQINGVEYVRKDSVSSLAQPLDGMDFCIVRCRDAGVFAGYVKEHDGGEVVLVNSIRLHAWYGASLSQLSQEGTPDTSKCRFAMTEAIKTVEGAIEVTPCTEKARINLQSVNQWRC